MTADHDASRELLAAAATGDVELADLALDVGADLEAIEPRQGTALVVAARAKHEQLVQRLLERGADVHHDHDWALVEAARAGALNIVKLLLAHDADPIDAERTHEFGLVLAAVEGGNPRVLELVLEHVPPDPELAWGDDDARPINNAARRGRPDLVRILLDAGEPPDPRGVEGEGTADGPLAYAAERGHLEIVQLLIDAGARVDAAHYDGRTALAIARDAGHDAIARLLERYGARR